MAVTFYQSTDASAPSLSGTAGSLITLLDAILVNGYGAKSAAGWAKTYSTTNIAVYTQGSGSNGFKLRVLDDGSVTGGAKEAMVRGCESATGHSTTTDDFPLTTQVANNSCVWRKSDTADGTARAWKAVADSTFIILWVNFSGSNNGDVYYFGDMQPIDGGTDSYGTVLVQRNSANSTSAGLCWGNAQAAIIGGANPSHVSHWCRTRDGVVKSSMSIAESISSSVGGYGYNLTYTSSVANPSISSKLPHRKTAMSDWYSQNTTMGSGCLIRGYFKYLHEPMVGANAWVSWLNGDTFSNSSYGGGSSFMLLSASGALATSPNGQVYRFLFQYSGTFT